MLTDHYRLELDIKRRISVVQARYSEVVDKLKLNQLTLEKFEASRCRYDTLYQILELINKLDSQGGIDLLWGDNCSDSHSDENKRRVTTLIEDHQKQLKRSQDERETLKLELSKLESDNSTLLIQLQNLQDEIATSQADFIIDRKPSAHPGHFSTLPWSDYSNDVTRLRLVMVLTLVVSALMGYIIPAWELPEPERNRFIEIPDRLAKLVVKKTPPPPVSVPEKKATDEIKPDDTTEVPPPDDNKIKEARKIAEQKGLLAFKQDFTEIINASSDIRLGAQSAKINKQQGRTRNHRERSLITSTIKLPSDNFSVASLQRKDITTENDLTQISFSRIENTVLTTASEKAVGKRDNSKPVRNDEEIQVIFDRYKNTLYRIYRRELRIKPYLKGTLVLRLIIDPSGTVSECDLDSSDMDAPEFESKIIARVLKFNFGEKHGSDSLTILYPINFLSDT